MLRQQRRKIFWQTIAPVQCRRPGAAAFAAGWSRCFWRIRQRALFIHYEVDARLLQRELPFALDFWQGKAFVSLVAFTMCDLHPRFGGRATAWLFKPISTHGFLNARTYVKHGDERGIYFITEWLSNRLSVARLSDTALRSAVSVCKIGLPAHPRARSAFW